MSSWKQYTKPIFSAHQRPSSWIEDVFGNPLSGWRNVEDVLYRLDLKGHGHPQYHPQPIAEICQKFEKKGFFEDKTFGEYNVSIIMRTGWYYTLKSGKILTYWSGKGAQKGFEVEGVKETEGTPTSSSTNFPFDVRPNFAKTKYSNMYKVNVKGSLIQCYGVSGKIFGITLNQMKDFFEGAEGKLLGN